MVLNISVFVFLMRSTIMAFRKANLEKFVKKYGIKFGFMSVFSKAAAYALQDQPVVNAVIDDGVSYSPQAKQAPQPNRHPQFPPHPPNRKSSTATTWTSRWRWPHRRASSCR